MAKMKILQPMCEISTPTLRKDLKWNLNASRWIKGNMNAIRKGTGCKLRDSRRKNLHVQRLQLDSTRFEIYLARLELKKVERKARIEKGNKIVKTPQRLRRNSCSILLLLKVHVQKVCKLGGLH